MLSLKERIELLERDIQANPPAFTMSSDLPFAIFRYDPFHSDEREWHVRREIQKLATRVHNTTNRNVHIISLAQLYWKSIEESEGVEEIIHLEKDRGFITAEKQVNQYLSDPDWRPITDLVLNRIADFVPDKDMVFFTRAGVFAPASYRVSALLEQLMGHTRVPAILFYPGTWSESLIFMNLKSPEAPLGSYRVKIYGRDS